MGRLDKKEQGPGARPKSDKEVRVVGQEKYKENIIQRKAG